MINGTAAAAPSALRLMIAGRLRIGLSIALASSMTRQSRGQVSNGLEVAYTSLKPSKERLTIKSQG